jgi:sigma-E factor negative regulatory protein RseC
MTKDKIMYKEELYEEGIVKEAHNGIAEIVISDSDHCQECSVKVYCKPGSSNERSLTVKDPFGVHPGDKVRVIIKGSKILSASFMIYGLPLLLLLAGVFIGMHLFNNNQEIYSSLLGIGAVTLYAVGIMIFSKKEKTNSFPEITFVSSSR